MKIALIQQHATQDCEDNLRRGIESFHQAAKSGAKLIAFAELAFSSFLKSLQVRIQSPKLSLSLVRQLNSFPSWQRSMVW